MPLTKQQQRLWKEYRHAVAEYDRITNYLAADQGILTKPERDLLLDFAHLAKRKSDRLYKAFKSNKVPLRKVN